MSFERKTVAYKTLHFPGDSHDVLLDIYLPISAILHSKLKDSQNGSNHKLAVLIYFHGGGLTVGNRISWFPTWLQKRITDAGHIFISPDYRLIPSGSTTGHDIFEDIKDVFRFIVNYSSELPSDSSNSSSTPKIRLEIDPDRIAAILSLYGMGGNFLTPHYYLPKNSVFFQGREILDPTLFEDLRYPECQSSSSRVITDSPNTYFPPDSPDIVGKPGSLTNTGPPGFPSNRRMFLGRLYLQLGEYLDYYTGEHEPTSLSAAIRKEAQQSASSSENSRNLQECLAHIIPSQHLHLFPSLLPAHAYASWPPHLHGLLRKAGVTSVMSVAEGMEHSFDYQPAAEVVHKEEFDRIGRWLDGFLKPIASN
ncbi:alpha/beta-hydrolase [Gymnopus androsaceus JB14]|uniref:Alpha/beta-hydrolase n=1 Tax=Gymnopus androsaceus JB14 TaxID=1447944 RepID=A0A6A4I9U2_9AGAR|nr:alpha/beta-hydrolase [Gymnopus androsaceus JB14]